MHRGLLWLRRLGVRQHILWMPQRRGHLPRLPVLRPECKRLHHGAKLLENGFFTSIGMELSLDKTRDAVFGAASVDATAQTARTCGGIAVQGVQK